MANRVTTTNKYYLVLCVIVAANLLMCNYYGSWLPTLQLLSPSASNNLGTHIHEFSFSRIYHPGFSRDWSVGFIENTPVMPQSSTDAAIAPLLSVFIRFSGRYLQRIVDNLGFPLAELVIVQDEADPSAIAAVDELVLTLRKQTPDKRMIRRVTHIINMQHTGCSRAWNTVIRMFPHHRYWMMMSDDVMFESGQFQKFYQAVINATDDKFAGKVGAISTQVRFPHQDNLRTTFGLMAWAITRAGVLQAGLFDENYFPAYFEDDDYVLRMYLSGLEFYAADDTVALHGSNIDGTKGYSAGTAASATSEQASQYSDEIRRGFNSAYHKFKWGSSTSSFTYGIQLNDYTQSCMTDPNRYCSPFGQSALRPLSYWPFFALRHECILTGRGEQIDSRVHATLSTCNTFMFSPYTPLELGDIGTHGASNNSTVEKNLQLYEEAYQRNMQRQAPLKQRAREAISKNLPDWDWTRGFNPITNNQGQIWDFYEPVQGCQNKERLGRVGDGGKWLCNPQLLGQDGQKCVVYSFGSNGEISFEEDLMKLSNYQCEIHVFDPTMTKPLNRWVNNQKFNGPSALDLNNATVREELKQRNLFFHELGLSHTAAHIPEIGRVDSLANIMQKLGHSHVDVLKIDIEGAEFSTFEDDIFKQEHIDNSLPASQLLMELHHSDPTTIMNFFDALEVRGFRLFSKEPVTYGDCAAERICHQMEFGWIKV